MAYNKTIWKNKGELNAPEINKDNLNNIENGIELAHNAVDNLINVIYPIGCFFETTDTTFNPNTSFGGTWEEDTTGTVLSSKSTTIGSLLNDDVGEIVGEDKHTLTIAEIPSHQHEIQLGIAEGTPTGRYTSFVDSGRLAYNTQNNKGTTAAGSGQSHNIIQKTLIVKRWHRTE